MSVLPISFYLNTQCYGAVFLKSTADCKFNGQCLLN